jgi:hypothetical protein
VIDRNLADLDARSSAGAPPGAQNDGCTHLPRCRITGTANGPHVEIEAICAQCGRPFPCPRYLEGLDRESLVASLVEGEVLEPTGMWEVDPDADGMVIGGDQGIFEDEDHPPDARLLYRIRGAGPLVEGETPPASYLHPASP